MSAENPKPSVEGSVFHPDTRLSVDPDTHEEIVHWEYDESWDAMVPVRFMRSSDGGGDVHCQTGPAHRRAIFEARQILKARGILFAEEWSFMGPTGAYYTVTHDGEVEGVKDE